MSGRARWALALAVAALLGWRLWLGARIGPDGGAGRPAAPVPRSAGPADGEPGIKTVPEERASVPVSCDARTPEQIARAWGKSWGPSPDGKIIEPERQAELKARLAAHLACRAVAVRNEVPCLGFGSLGRGLPGGSATEECLALWRQLERARASNEPAPCLAGEGPSSVECAWASAAVAALRADKPGSCPEPLLDACAALLPGRAETPACDPSAASLRAAYCALHEQLARRRLAGAETRREADAAKTAAAIAEQDSRLLAEAHAQAKIAAEAARGAVKAAKAAAKSRRAALSMDGRRRSLEISRLRHEQFLAKQEAERAVRHAGLAAAAAALARSSATWEAAQRAAVEAQAGARQALSVSAEASVGVAEDAGGPPR